MLDNKLSINETAPIFAIPVPSTLWRWFQEYKKKENQDVVMKEEIMSKKTKSQNNKKNKEITNVTIQKEELSSNILLEEEIKNLRKQLKDKDKELKETKQELYHTQMQRDIIKKKLNYIKIEEEISIESSVLIIADLKRTYPVKDLLCEFNIPKSTFYDNFKYITKTEDDSFIYLKPDKYKKEKELILEIFNSSRCTYGYRRIKQALKLQGVTLNHKTIKKLMKELNIKSQIRCRKKTNNYYNISSGIASSNIINRDFEASHPNEKWATDITEFKFINNEKFYLSVVIDMFNSEVINYTIGNSPNLELVKNMMLGAIKNVPKNDLKNLILHSDQGWHYRHQNFREILEEFEINQSMSRKGTPIDNAKMESFFAILKTEFLTKENIEHFNNVDELFTGLDNFINFYNTERIKLKLKTSPIKYREMKGQNN